MFDFEEKLKGLLEYFKTENKIVAVYLIGSFGTEFQREDSDIDFAFLFDGEVDFFEETRIKAKISEILKFDDVDLVNLMKAPIVLQVRAINEGRELFVSDYIKLSDYIEYVYRRYRDEKYFIDCFNKDYFYSFKNRGVSL